MSSFDRAGGPLVATLATALATLVHVLTAAVVAAGVVLLWPGSTLFQKLLGVGCLVLAYALRPSVGERRSPGGTRVDLRRCPQTRALLDEVADAVGVRAPAEAEVVSDPRADLRLTGVHGRVVAIGAPLWVALDGPERVALLGHQLGHLTSGATWLLRYVGGAVRTLERWEGVLAPYRPEFGLTPEQQILMRSSSGGHAVEDSAATGLFADVVSVLLAPLRLAVRGYRRLLERAYAPVRARVALGADTAATAAAGTAGTTRWLEVLLALAAVETSANRAAATHTDIAGAIRSRLASYDAGQRRTARSGAAGHRVDDDHPDTLARLRHVESAERREPAVAVGASRWAAVDAELAAAVAAQLRRHVDDLRYAH